MEAQEIKKVTPAEANAIIDTREPLGVFYTIDSAGAKPVYVGIDNRDGDAWTEDFKCLSTCKRWLLE
jgi:hypothetical protein